MEKICLQTENCCKNFLLLMIEKMTSICEQKTEEIKNLENLGNERDVKITNLNVEISNLMAQNIEICISLRRDPAEKCGGALCYTGKSNRLLRAI